ncbi:TRAP transporter small permease [Mesobacterium pallidum]|uniref:TRAP transporter small permease n=1 Tax=Mesobacterium pallidum TaxID=2872037 RepID=UPI001EE1EEE8|nr:TRAP transporter small permease [Mesobacterium pallidum]
MEKVMGKCMAAVQVVLGLILIAMVGLSVWNVVARYVFNAALLWADEVAVYAMIVITWFGAIVAAWRRADIAMSLVVDMLGPPWRRALAVIQSLVTAGACGWVTWLSYGYVLRVFKFGMTSDAAHIPMWIVHGSITLSLASIALIALWRVAGLLAVGPDRAQPYETLTAENTSS